MGNVLVRFDPELFMDRYSLTGEDRKLIRNEVFRSVEWIMLDRGVIDEEIAEQRILPLLPERLHGAARGLIEKWDDPHRASGGNAGAFAGTESKGAAVSTYFPTLLPASPSTGHGQRPAS